MTTTLGILLFILCFCPFLGWADCASYFLELNQKMAARETKSLIRNEDDIKKFIQETEKLTPKNRDLFLSRMMELAKKDFDLAQDYARILSELYGRGTLSKSKLEEIIAINNESKLVFAIKDQTVTYVINLSEEALKNAALIPQRQWEIVNLNLSLEMQKQLVSKLQEIETIKNQTLVSSAMNFLASLSEVEKISFIHEFDKIGDSANATSSLVKKFQRNLKRFNKFENSVLKDLQKELKSFNPKLSEEEIFSQAKSGAKSQRNIYENLSYGCKGSTGSQTVEQKVAAAKFTRFRSVMGLATNVSMYAYFNWDKEKDATWFAKLGYDLSMGQAMNYVNSKIVTNNKDSYFTKSLKNYGVYSVSDLASSLLYEKIFGTSDKTLEEKLEQLKNDPDFREEVKKLHKVLEEAKVEENIISQMDYLFTDKDFDPEKITPKDLESPEIRELFLELMAKSLYLENQGGVIQTGSTAMDRFAFSRLYGVVASTKGMAINLLIYNILCMGGANPALAYLKAGTVFMIDNLITCYFYYKLRREMINQ